MVKVSVIVPVYNVKDYLRQCLDSLAAQTLDELEVLVVDDGSTDGSGAIADDYAARYPERFRVFHKENGGQASARNLALAHARGEYLGFVDSDDWVDQGMYESLYCQASANRLDIVICNMMEHYANDRQKLYDVSQADNKFHQTPSACNKLFSRRFVGQVTFPVGLWYEDMDFTTKLLFLTDRIEHCPDAFYHYRQTQDESTMRNQNAPKNLDMLSVLDDLFAFAQREGLADRYAEDLEYLVLEHLLITSINRVSRMRHPDKRAVIAQMRRYVKNRCPHYRSDAVFRAMPRNRRIVASLNGWGLHDLSRLLLRVSAARKRS